MKRQCLNTLQHYIRVDAVVMGGWCNGQLVVWAFILLIYYFLHFDLSKIIAFARYLPVTPALPVRNLSITPGLLYINPRGILKQLTVVTLLLSIIVEQFVILIWQIMWWIGLRSNKKGKHNILLRSPPLAYTWHGGHIVQHPLHLWYYILHSYKCDANLSE